MRDDTGAAAYEARVSREFIYTYLSLTLMSLMPPTNGSITGILNGTLDGDGSVPTYSVPLRRIGPVVGVLNTGVERVSRNTFRLEKNEQMVRMIIMI